MIDVTTTIYCETCQTLQDAVVYREFSSDPNGEIPPRGEKRKSPPSSSGTGSSSAPAAAKLYWA